jgi:hypothetical protein
VAALGSEAGCAAIHSHTAGPNDGIHTLAPVSPSSASVDVPGTPAHPRIAASQPGPRAPFARSRHTGLAESVLKGAVGTLAAVGFASCLHPLWVLPWETTETQWRGCRRMMPPQPAARRPGGIVAFASSGHSVE